MIQTIYIIITIYFILGAMGFFFINRKKPKEEARQSWIKYISYYLIINTMFFSITLSNHAFQLVCLLIMGMAFYEIINTHIKSKSKYKSYLYTYILLIAFLGVGIINYSQLNSNVILFVFILLSIFDSFSQISGQIFGKHKICPSISPKKTYEGFIGGLITVVISAFVLRDLYPSTTAILVSTAILICLSAFIGDLGASLYKRKYQIKDYSQLIPGHGGVLDRFDSFIGTGAIIGYLHIFI